MATSSKRRLPIFTVIIAGVFIVFWVGLLSGSIMWTSDQPPLMVIPDMDNQSKVSPQEQVNYFADRSADRAPLEYTIPRYAEFYRATSIAEAEEMYSNSLPSSEWILARGKNRFDTFCAVCHGAEGAGDGTIGERSATLKPPSLIAPGALTLSYTDAHLFHIISMGQNIMPGYRDKLKEVDRWAVVNYVRSLQRKHLGEDALQQAHAEPDADMAMSEGDAMTDANAEGEQQ